MYIYVHTKDACRLPSAELVILDNEYINENINGNINSTLAFVVTPADKSVRKMIDICVYCARGSHRHIGCIAYIMTAQWLPMSMHQVQLCYRHPPAHNRKYRIPIPRSFISSFNSYSVTMNRSSLRDFADEERCVTCSQWFDIKLCKYHV